MKKIYILSIASLLGFSSLNAQYVGSSPFRGKPVKSNVAKKIYAGEKNRATETFFVDYEYADQTRQDFEFGISDWIRYIWDFNFRYPTTATNSERYAVVSFFRTGSTLNTINDSYGTALTAPGYPQDVAYTSGITIDSVFVNCGHENNSGTNDTLEFQVISVDAAGHPGAGPSHTVLFSKKVINNTSFVGQTDWLYGGVVGEALGYTVPAGQRFGICVKYYGNTTDTFGILAGFGNNGGSCGATPTLPFFAVASLYAPNTYRLDIQYESYGLLPTTTGADTYYECDGTSGYAPGTDSENTMQNLALWMKVTANTSGVKVDEANNVITNLGQNMPNPFNVNSTINYSLSAAVPVAFTVTDLSGKVVMSSNYGTQMAGAHSINMNANQFESGVYYYTLTAGSQTMTKKMIVTK